jgi:hypothetical protein
MVWIKAVATPRHGSTVAQGETPILQYNYYNILRVHPHGLHSSYKNATFWIPFMIHMKNFDNNSGWGPSVINWWDPIRLVSFVSFNITESRK